jgi:hypothetical protein
MRFTLMAAVHGTFLAGLLSLVTGFQPAPEIMAQSAPSDTELSPARITMTGTTSRLAEAEASNPQPGNVALEVGVWHQPTSPSLDRDDQGTLADFDPGELNAVRISFRQHRH